MIEPGLDRRYHSVAKRLLESGAVRFGSFRLKLHEENPGAPLSPYYINLRILRSFPHLMECTAQLYLDLAQGLVFDLLADVPTSATPTVAMMSYLSKIPMITPRSDVKSHGLTTQVDGIFREGQVVLLVDDIITTADSKLEAIRVLEGN